MKKLLIMILTAAVLSLAACSAGAGGSTTQQTETVGSGKSETDSLADKAYDRTIYDAMTVPYMSLRAYGQHGEEALDAGVAEIRRLDDLLSTGKASSETASVNTAGSGTLSDDAAYLTDVSLELYESTEGAFDITVYPLMELWGFTTQFTGGSDKTDGAGDTDKTDKSENAVREAPTESEIETVLGKVDASQIDFDASTGSIALPDGMRIDFGGIAKGYTSQRVTDIFRQIGVTSALIDLGGNIQTVGSKPDGSEWKIALNDRNRGTYLGVVRVCDMAVISSGGYERNFTAPDGRVYHHILDPKTGYPADNGFSVNASVSIICRDGTLADGLSTALYVMGPLRAIEYWRAHCDEFDFVLMTDDDKMYVSEGLENCFSSDTYKYEIVRK